MTNRTTGPRSFGTEKKKCWFEEANNINPGPGSHDSKRIDRIECPMWPIGADTNRQSFLELEKEPRPSPSHYNSNLKSIQKHSPRATVSKGNSNKINQISSTFYNADDFVTKVQVPSFTFGYTIDTNFNTGVPGPGTYDCSLKQQNFNKNQHILGISQRPLPYGEEGKNPGPNKYAIMNSKKNIQYSFPKSLRKDSELRNDKEPLAAFYNLSPKKKTIRTARNYDDEIHRQANLSARKQNPAPNAYNLKPNHIRNIIFEKSHRIPQENKDLLKFPGPDKYDTININSLSHEKQKNGISFPRQLQRLFGTEWITPGPGPAAYDYPKIISKIGGAINKHQQLQQFHQHSPGSGHYSPKENMTNRKAQSTIVFKSNRIDFSRTITGPIGPGYYDIPSSKQSIQLGKIGKSDRKQIFYPYQHPGVGSYNLPGYFGKLPNYYDHSPRKITSNGYSIYHQKLNKVMKRQKVFDKVSNPELQYENQNDSPNQTVKKQLQNEKDEQI